MKKIFNRLMACALVCAAFVYTSCTKDLQNDIAGLGDRLTAVENSLNSLKGQIEAGAVVTDVKTTATGVTVTLSNGSSFDLKNGADGAKGDKGDKGEKGDTGATGATGAPGSVVTIGQDGYWYIDGKKTDLLAQGPQGEKGETGADGLTVYYEPDVTNNKWIKVTVAGNADGTDLRETTEMSVYAPGTLTAVWNPEKGTLELANVDGAENGLLTLSWAALNSNVEDLLARVQSLVFVPEFEDGKARIEYVLIGDSKNVNICTSVLRYKIDGAKLTDAEVAAVAKAITKDQLYFDIKSVTPLTKGVDAPSFDIIEVVPVGYGIDVYVRPANFTDEFWAGKNVFSASLTLNDGNNSRSSEYANLTASKTEVGLMLAKKDVNNKWVALPVEGEKIPHPFTDTATTDVLLNGYEPIFVVGDNKYTEAEVENALMVDIDIKYGVTINYMDKNDVAITDSPTVWGVGVLSHPSLTLSDVIGDENSDYAFALNNKGCKVNVSLPHAFPREQVDNYLDCAYTYTINGVEDAITANSKVVISRSPLNIQFTTSIAKAPWDLKTSDGLRPDGVYVFNATHNSLEDVGTILTALALANHKKVYFNEEEVGSNSHVSVGQFSIAQGETPGGAVAKVLGSAPKFSAAAENTYKVVWNGPYLDYYDVYAELELVFDKIPAYTVPAEVTLKPTVDGSKFIGDVKLVDALKNANYAVGYEESQLAKICAAINDSESVHTNVVTLGENEAESTVTFAVDADGDASSIELSADELAKLLGDNKLIDGHKITIKHTVAPWYDEKATIEFNIDVTIDLPDYKFGVDANFVQNGKVRVLAAVTNDLYTVNQADLAKYFNVYDGGKKSLADSDNDLKVKFELDGVDAYDGYFIDNKTVTSKTVSVANKNNATGIVPAAVANWGTYNFTEITAKAYLYANGYVVDEMEVILYTEDPLAISNSGDITMTHTPNKQMTIYVWDKIKITAAGSTDDLLPKGSASIATILAALQQNALDTKYGAKIDIAMAPLRYKNADDKEVNWETNKYEFVKDANGKYTGKIVIYNDDAYTNFNLYTEVTVTFSHNICDPKKHDVLKFKVIITKSNN